MILCQNLGASSKYSPQDIRCTEKTRPVYNKFPDCVKDERKCGPKVVPIAATKIGTVVIYAIVT